MMAVNSARPGGMARRAASRLLPRSLFGQLMLIFTVAFLAFLVISALHAAETRRYYLLRGLMAERVRRMVDMTLLLDTADEDGRALLMERMSIRGFSISIQTGAPVPPSTEEVRWQAKGAMPASPENLNEASALLTRLLNLALADMRQDRHAPSLALVRRAETETQNIPHVTRAVVHEINVPGTWEEIRHSWKQLFGPRDVMPRIYHATAALPLSDGTYAVFDDAAPGFPMFPDFPLRGILLVEIFFVLVSLLAFYLVVRPLRRLARAADNFGRDLPGMPPLPENGPREVREAAQAFNRMQRRIRDFVDERSRTLAAVSHDLRTPLTRMRLRVEQLDEAQRLPLQKDMDELQQLMDTTIDLARGSSGEDFAPVDVAALVESLVEDRQDMGQNVVLEQAGNLDGIPPLLARPLSIKRCLSNLLDNAVRYGGGAVVSVRDSRELLEIVICDTGPGIPETDLNRVFEPFFRLEPSRSRSTGGSGLGLSIARSMARQHRGDIVLTNRPEGGLCANLSLPRPSGPPCDAKRGEHPSPWKPRPELRQRKTAPDTSSSA